MECSKSLGAARCSSIWVTRAYIQWANALHHSLIKFDESRLGQVVVKSTTLSTDLPLHHWHDLRRNHGAHPRGEKLNSSDLSRYPEQMIPLFQIPRKLVVGVLNVQRQAVQDVQEEGLAFRWSACPWRQDLPAGPPGRASRTGPALQRMAAAIPLRVTDPPLASLAMPYVPTLFTHHSLCPAPANASPRVV